jgi:hypothetical protein
LEILFYPFLKKQSVAAVGTSLAQDAAATVLGSEQGVEGGKAVVSGVGGMMSEPIARFLGKFTVPVIKYAGKKIGQGVDKILPEGLAASQFNIFSGSGQFLNSKGIVTNKAIDIGRKVGVDTNLINKKNIN